MKDRRSAPHRWRGVNWRRPRVEAEASTIQVDPRAFRDALAQFATGVAIVTTVAADGTRIGVTVSSFNSVSLDPPLVLFSVARSAYSLPAFLGARRYAVNILCADQAELSTRFARALEDKWGGSEWQAGGHGLPLAPGALAAFECDHYAEYDGGDHLILVGRVTRFERSPDGRPLLFFRGRYHQISEF
jgi:flavin reductase (DIM6/NTAB) family NADH-FMN oxidoreductase RutF